MISTRLRNIKKSGTTMPLSTSQIIHRKYQDIPHNHGTFQSRENPPRQSFTALCISPCSGVRIHCVHHCIRPHTRPGNFQYVLDRIRSKQEIKQSPPGPQFRGIGKASLFRKCVGVADGPNDGEFKGFCERFGCDSPLRETVIPRPFPGPLDG